MNTIVLAILLASIGVLLPLYGGGRPPARVTIPFDFVVGENLLMAGSYTLEKLDERAWVLVIKSTDGDSVVYTQTSLVDGGDARSERPKLIFHRCRDIYFLAQIWVPSSARELPKSRLERELAAAGAPIEEVRLGTTPPPDVLYARLRNALFDPLHKS